MTGTGEAENEYGGADGAERADAAAAATHADDADVTHADADAEDAAVTGDAAGSPPAGLSARDMAVLAFERRGHPQGSGVKERAVREQLGMSPTRYYQLLNALLDDPYALAHDPVTVHRLRARRDAHRARR